MELRGGPGVMLCGVGEGLVDVGLLGEGCGELCELAVAFDPVVLVFGAEDPGGGPAQAHVPSPAVRVGSGGRCPVLHVVSVGSDDLNGRFDRVRGRHGTGESAGDPEPVDGHRLRQALP